MDLTTALLVGIMIAGGIYFVLEIRETFKYDPPSKPMSGLESAIGKKAFVSQAFSQTGAGVLIGRVEFDGESWRAEFAGNPASAPNVGQSVRVCDVDTGTLTVTVKLEGSAEPE